MSRGPVVNVTITGDASALDKAFKSAADGVNGFGGSLKRVFNEKIISGGIGLLQDAAKAAIDFGKQGIENFDALGDATAILDANFKDLSKAVDKLDLTKLGFDKIETANAAKDISDTAKALGLSGREAARIVPALTQAAAGYSALTGKDAQSSGDLFAKALGGSAKAAKELGVQFTAGMTPAERMQAVMAKWGPLAEDAANGTRSLADEQATFDAQMVNVSTTVGEFLNEALTPVLQMLNENLFPALADFSKKYGPDIRKVVKALGDIFGRVFGFIGSEIVPIVLEVGGAIGKELKPVLKTVSETMKAWEPIFKAVWGWIKTNVVPFVTSVLVPALSGLFQILGKVSQIVAGALIAAWSRLGPVIGKVGDILRKVLGFINDIIRKVASAPIIKDFLGFISGGSSRSGSGASGGAFSTPQGGLKPVSITVNTGVGDPVAIGRQVSRVLGAYSARTGHI